VCGFTVEHNVLCYYMYLYPSLDSIIEASMLISHCISVVNSTRPFSVLLMVMVFVCVSNALLTFGHLVRLSADQNYEKDSILFFGWS